MEEKPCNFPELLVTLNIRKTLQQVIKCASTTLEAKNEYEKILESDKAVISTKMVREIYNTLRNEGHKVFLHEIVEDALLIPQSISLPPRNPVLEARINKLKILEENREYKRMTRNLGPKSHENFTFQEEVKSLNKQLITVFNFFLTVVAGFAFGYKSTEYMFGHTLAMQMMSGLIVGLVVFFVDLYFLLRYTI
ncbi:transmembrane protein 199-like [Physella acuta]|uniref:transmembrane protein 199-like n=1 Tax=Physella acuta TaxID=109671 RepID=UPI0027DC6C9A|nr:transmembrane protein 199-like [Physella acuta]